MGAGLAFQAALDRYTRQDLVLLSYHVHIPRPDPMVNPSTLARMAFYGVNSSPSYMFDGDKDGGGGSAEGAKSLFETKIDPIIAKHFDVKPEAAIALNATRVGPNVKVKAKVSNVTSKSDKLKVQIALVEDQVPFSGENGMRFHEMVVRAMAPSPATKPAPKPAAADKKAEADTAKPAPLALGFALKPGQGGSFEYTFDIAKAVADAKAHLDDFESKPVRGADYKFRQKKHEINTTNLSVVAFVQDETTKKVLQVVYIKVPAAKVTTN